MVIERHLEAPQGPALEWSRAVLGFLGFLSLELRSPPCGFLRKT